MFKLRDVQGGFKRRYLLPNGTYLALQSQDAFHYVYGHALDILVNFVNIRDV